MPAYWLGGRGCNFEIRSVEERNATLFICAVLECRFFRIFIKKPEDGRGAYAVRAQLSGGLHFPRTCFCVYMFYEPAATKMKFSSSILAVVVIRCVRPLIVLIKI